MDGRAQYPVAKFSVRIEAPTCRWTLTRLEGRWSFGTVARGSLRSIRVKF
jgi:hypothetical protein